MDHHYWAVKIGEEYVSSITKDGGIHLCRSPLDRPYQYHTKDEAMEAAALLFHWTEQEPEDWKHNRRIGVVEFSIQTVEAFLPSVTPRPPPVPKRYGERVWHEATQACLDCWSDFCMKSTGHPNCFEMLEKKSRRPVMHLWEPCYERRADGGAMGVIKLVTKRAQNTFWGHESDWWQVSGDGVIWRGPAVLKKAWKRQLKELLDQVG